MTKSQLERRVHFLIVYACGSSLLLLIVLLSVFSPDRSPWMEWFAGDVVEADTVIAQVLQTNQVTVVDRGVIRVRLGSQLPDAVIAGRQVPRGGDAAGMLLYDATGQERGGYVTFDSSGNVILTLDGRMSQTAYFVADTSGTTALRIWRENDAIDLRTDADGARMSVIRDGSVVLQQPAARNPAASVTCATLRKLRMQYSDQQIMSACRGRMTEEWCDECLN